MDGLDAPKPQMSDLGPKYSLDADDAQIFSMFDRNSRSEIIQLIEESYGNRARDFAKILNAAFSKGFIPVSLKEGSKSHVANSPIKNTADFLIDQIKANKIGYEHRDLSLYYFDDNGDKHLLTPKNANPHQLIFAVCALGMHSHINLSGKKYSAEQRRNAIRTHIPDMISAITEVSKVIGRLANTRGVLLPEHTFS